MDTGHELLYLQMYGCDTYDMGLYSRAYFELSSTNETMPSTEDLRTDEFRRPSTFRTHSGWFFR